MSNEGEWGYEDWDQPRGGEAVTEFTKEQLAHWAQTQPLAAFALALLERAENAEAERDRLRDAWVEAIGTIRAIGDAVGERGDELKILAAVRTVAAERDRLKGELEEAEEAIRYFATKVDLARPAKFHPIDTRRTVIFSCKADGTWNHDPVCSSAVRRAMERGK